MHTNSKLLFKTHASGLFRERSRVLEVGPDGFPSSYRKLVRLDALEWHTLDIDDNERLTYPRSEQYSFRIPDGVYDVVLAGNVIEHVKKIWEWTKEIARVCKVNGTVIILVPVSWHFHEAPVDCWRIYPEGMKALLENAGLEVVLCQFESMEAPGYRRYTPGISPECQSRALRWFCRLAGHLGFPVERAYDTIAIARKL